MLALRPSPVPSLGRAFSTNPQARKATPHLFDVTGTATYPPSHSPSSHSHSPSHPASTSTSAHAHPHGVPHPLRLVMFGKPGSGKGTLSTRLTSKYLINFISTGDSLRRHIARRTPLGKRAETLVAEGKFLPDDVMLQVVTSELEALPPPSSPGLAAAAPGSSPAAAGQAGQSWILDGFPRTVPQARMLDAYLSRLAPPQPLTLVVHLDVPDSVILSRIQDRWVHLPSGRVYNLAYNPPRVPGRDDLTGEPLQKRPDDTPEVFKKRLEVFERETAPLLRYYKSVEGGVRVVTLRGETSDEIWPGLEREVGGFDLPLRGEKGGVRVEEEFIRRAEEERGKEGEAVRA